MGLRAAGVTVATSFLLGILFTHWIADSLTLWQSPLTDDHLRTAAIYYSAFATQPQWMTWVLLGVTGIGATSLLASFRDGEAGNVMFDGASIFLYICTIYIYWSSVVPNLSEVFLRPLPQTPSSDVPFPDDLRQPTIELASSHLICSVALTGVLLLQAGRAFAEEEDASEKAEDEAEERKQLERQRRSSEGARGRKRPQDEDEAAAVSVPARKSPSARRKDIKATAPRAGSSSSSSVGRSAGSRIRRPS
ncbi:hypothetical protein M407DRAFT_244574 [Tulasnella calospora MUT 4182]|uniref:Shr3 amino acid permease chaperone n=1 Tax=Tulasnella calospora MUT 4182 TaxID=1051891 RepID=A0A0C3LRN1_9AGAM|nr:hypothetical protein M407DRAFT_244574 [Tulasnella calospora MUT 4182]